jgi:hypothetical protein
MPHDDDKVGYGRPPKHSQFRPGQSGNRSGRPKRTRNILSDLRAELQSTTTITELGRQLTVTKQEAIVKSLVAAAIDGDMRAISTLVNITRTAETEDRQQDEVELSDDQAEIIQDFHHRKPEIDRGVPPNHPNSSRNDDEI